MENNGNGTLKKIKSILAILASLIVLSGSIWTYVENRIKAEVEKSAFSLRVEYDGKISKIRRDMRLMQRLDELRVSEKRLEGLLKADCPDKAPLQEEYACVQKSIEHIEKKFKHEKQGEEK